MCLHVSACVDSNTVSIQVPLGTGRGFDEELLSLEEDEDDEEGSCVAKE